MIIKKIKLPLPFLPKVETDTSSPSEIVYAFIGYTDVWVLVCSDNTKTRHRQQFDVERCNGIPKRQFFFSFVIANMNDGVNSYHVDAQDLRKFSKLWCACLRVKQFSAGWMRIFSGFSFLSKIIRPFNHYFMRITAVTIYSFNSFTNSHWLTPVSGQKLKNNMQIIFGQIFYQRYNKRCHSVLLDAPGRNYIICLTSNSRSSSN